MKLHHSIVAAVQVLCNMEDLLCSESHRQRNTEARKLQGITASLRLCKCCAERISILLPCFRAAVRNRSIEAAGCDSFNACLRLPCRKIILAAHDEVGSTTKVLANRMLMYYTSSCFKVAAQKQRQ